ncbi:MAG: hypothetical protein AB7H96_22480 [Vicinamibacterales bacterium]
MTTGQTRLVLLVGPYAIKIARPGVGYCLRRLASLRTSRGVTEKLAEWRQARGSVTRVILMAPFYGLLANLNEYRLSRRLPQAGLAETVLSVGVLNVQRRGRAVDDEDLSGHPVVRAMTQGEAWSELVIDSIRPEQFCRLNGRIEMVDYGNPALREFLERTHGLLPSTALPA